VLPQADGSSQAGYLWLEKGCWLAFAPGGSSERRLQQAAEERRAVHGCRASRRQRTMVVMKMGWKRVYLVIVGFLGSARKSSACHPLALPSPPSKGDLQTACPRMVVRARRWETGGC
jgi:hypothetical protein